ncbi:30S ribosomal protein S8e [Candidatus Woesearchaeota archaeon]|nr:30S ribosomal protein S8e [Candidatus Woesearchaeota archaeon]
MAIIQQRSKKKITGGRYRPITKRLANYGDIPTATKVGERKMKVKRARGGHDKIVVIAAKIANILDPKTKKSQKTEIVSVLENAANRNFIRRGILTKGTVIETKAGKAKVTSRPGQEGTVNAVLM